MMKEWNAMESPIPAAGLQYPDSEFGSPKMSTVLYSPLMNEEEEEG